MRNIIQKKELKQDYPLVERTISIEESTIFFDYELIGNLDLLLSFYKEYKDSEEALLSVNEFISTENRDTIRLKYISKEMDFQEEILFSKRKLITDIINKNINLPDGGNGYKYDGDINYLKYILDKYIKKDIMG